MIALLIILLDPRIIVETMYFDKGYIVLMTPWSNFIWHFLYSHYSQFIFISLEEKQRDVYCSGGCIMCKYYWVRPINEKFSAIDHSGFILMQYGYEINYYWSDFESIIYYYDQYSGTGIYNFTMKTGEKINLEEND